MRETTHFYPLSWPYIKTSRRLQGRNWPLLIRQRRKEVTRDNRDSKSSLGAKVSTDGEADDDIISRQGKVRAVFGKLTGVWKSSILSKRIRIFKSNVIPVLLYVCESWRMIKAASTTAASRELPWRGHQKGNAWQEDLKKRGDGLWRRREWQWVSTLELRQEWWQQTWHLGGAQFPALFSIQRKGTDDDDSRFCQASPE